MKVLSFLALVMLGCIGIANAEDAPRPALRDGAPGSIYAIQSKWNTARGDVIRLADLRGKSRVLAFFYAGCRASCPLIVDAMKRLEAALGPDAAKVGFVLVSFDSEDDTPKSLRAYAAKRGLDEMHWTLLVGNAEDTEELAVLTGSKYKRITSGTYSHSNTIILLDEEGRIVERTDAFDDMDRFKDDVRRRLENDDQRR